MCLTENNRARFINCLITAVILMVVRAVIVEGVNEARLVQGRNLNLGEALQFIREWDREAAGMCYRVTTAQWKYTTNITDLNKRKMIEEQTLNAKFEKLSWRKAVSFEWSRLPDPIVRRQLKLLAIDGRASLPDDKYNEIYHLIAEMKDIYNKVKVCSHKSYSSTYCDLRLEPDLVRTMAHSRNYDELLYMWTEWRRFTGPPVKNKFMRYVQLANQAARLTGFLDAGEQMQAIYEDDDFESNLAEVYYKIEPLYKELHAYVRRKLAFRYGFERVRADGPIPAHLLGNMWAQNWKNIIDLVRPFQTTQSLDVTDEMLRQGYTPLRMFQVAEEFFTSMGLKPMPPEFWISSMLERPVNRQVQCTASAWDFCNRVDYRIKQCTQVTADDLVSIHHEMAHVEYYLYYADQSQIFKDGANPAFHEAISEALTLSVRNPVHLHRIGLFNNNTDLYETNMNFLLTMALEKIAYIPFAYMVDQWRFKIFRDGVQNMNSLWWSMKLRYQGLIPPVARTEIDFDPGSKYHIISDQSYVKYFVAQVLQFQIYEALCGASNHQGQLHTCDLYRSREAGRILSEIMKLGRSRHWKDVIRIMTHGKTDRLSANAILKYFQPLELWLKVQNRGESIIGWNTNLEDTARFQPLRNVAYSIFLTNSKIVILISSFILIYH